MDDDDDGYMNNYKIHMQWGIAITQPSITWLIQNYVRVWTRITYQKLGVSTVRIGDKIDF